MTNKEFEIALEVMKTGNDLEELGPLVAKKALRMAKEDSERGIDRLIEIQGHFRPLADFRDKRLCVGEEIALWRRKIAVEKDKFYDLARTDDLERLKCLKKIKEIKEIINRLMKEMNESRE